MGDFAKTSDGAANAAKIATASLEDQQAKIGAFLLPAWSGFLSFVNTSVIPALSWLGDAIALVQGSFTGLGADVDMGAMTNPLIDVGAKLREVYDVAQEFCGGVVGGVRESGDTVKAWAITIASAVAAYYAITGAIAVYN